MIRYRLKCKKGHEFEGWFSGSAAFDTQAKQGRVRAQPAEPKVSKALMAPASPRSGKPKVVQETSSRRPRAAKARDARVAAHRRAGRRHAQAAGRDRGQVGVCRLALPEEARKIHYEESPARGIRGEATARKPSPCPRRASNSSRCLFLPRTTIDGFAVVRPLLLGFLARYG
jgi:hypothetical protein